MEAVDAEVDCWLGSPLPELFFEKEAKCCRQWQSLQEKQGGLFKSITKTECFLEKEIGGAT